MSVYVDKERRPYGRMQMSHMMADTLAELLGMAELIGLKGKWLQWDRLRTVPHFDVCQSKKRMAIKEGAIEVSRRKVVEVIRVWRRARWGI